LKTADFAPLRINLACRATQLNYVLSAEAWRWVDTLR